MKTKLLSLLLIAGLATTVHAQRYAAVRNTTAGDAARITIPTGSLIDVTTAQSKTISFRIKTSPTTYIDSNYGRLLARNTSPTATATECSYAVSFEWGPGTIRSRPSISAAGKGPVAITTSGPAAGITADMNDGNWHYFAVILNDTDGKVKLYYYNNASTASDKMVLVNSSSTVGPFDFTGTLPLTFGAHSAAGNGIYADYDDIRIWDKALTRAEMNLDGTTAIHTSNLTTGAEAVVGTNNSSKLLLAYDFEGATLAGSGIKNIVGNTAYDATATQGSSTNASALSFIDATTTESTLTTQSFEKNNLNVSIEKNNDVLTITAPEARTITAEVYDITGKVVDRTKSTTNVAKVSLGTAKGMYIVKITDGKASFTQKVVK